MKIVFADSFYFFALLICNDQAHDRALALTSPAMGKIVTTPWVLTEVADGLAAPINRHLFFRLVQILSEHPNAVTVPAEETLFRAGIALYTARGDKNWSLTDCISFEVMRRLGIQDALTGDHHFEQAGFVALLR